MNTEDFISGNANTLVSSSIAILNPNDIESYQVLKDASATAIYGARAAKATLRVQEDTREVLLTEDGRWLIAYSGNTVQVWDLQEQPPKRPTSSIELEHGVLRVLLLPDGVSLAVLRIDKDFDIAIDFLDLQLNATTRQPLAVGMPIRPELFKISPDNF